MADGLAVLDHELVDDRPLLLRDALFKVLLDIVRILLPGPSEPLGDDLDVHVNRDPAYPVTI